MSVLEKLQATLDPLGLIVRGGFNPRPEDQVPRPGRTMILIGNAGSAMWGAFRREMTAEPDPLDGWTRRHLDAIAASFGAAALYPFGGPPFLPFQRWAIKADCVHPSPVGPLIHPRYGLWHAYRGALLFSERLELPEQTGQPSPCLACPEKFCVKACPAGVFAQGKYDVPACLGELRRPGNDCADKGCLARHACPIGREYAYRPEHAAFHMLAFLGAFG